MSEVQGAAPAAVPGVPGQTAATGQPATQQTGSTGAPQVDAKALPPELFEVKVNGQIRKYTLDELRSKAILADGAHEKFQKASQTEKKFADWKQKAQTDAMSALMDPELGLSKDQIRTRFESWYKENFIDPEMMTKEQREAAQWKKEAEQYKKEKSQREEQEKTSAQEHLDSQTRQSVQEEIVSILDTSGLPKTRFTANRVAFWMKQNIKNGYDAPPEVIVQQVKDERNSIVASLTSTATPQQLVEMLGDELIKKLRTFDMEKLKARFQPATQSGSLSPNSGNAKPTGSRSMRDVDKYFNELRRTKK